MSHTEPPRSSSMSPGGSPSPDGVPTVSESGVALHDAPQVWDAVFAELEDLGFDLAELADSHLRPADTSPARRDELLAIARGHGVGLPRRSTRSGAASSGPGASGRTWTTRTARSTRRPSGG